MSRTSESKEAAWKVVEGRLTAIQQLTETIARLEASRDDLQRRLAAEKRAVMDATGLSWEQLNGRSSSVRQRLVAPPVPRTVSDGTLRGDRLRELVGEACASFGRTRWFTAAEVCSAIELSLQCRLAHDERKRVGASLQNAHERRKTLARRHRKTGSRLETQYRCLTSETRLTASSRATAASQATTVRHWVLAAIGYYEQENPHSRTDTDALRIYIEVQRPGLLEQQAPKALTHALVGLRRQGLIAKRFGTVHHRKPQWGLTDAGRTCLATLQRSTPDEGRKKLTTHHDTEKKNYGC